MIGTDEISVCAMMVPRPVFSSIQWMATSVLSSPCAKVQKLAGKPWWQGRRALRTLTAHLGGRAGAFSRSRCGRVIEISNIRLPRNEPLDGLRDDQVFHWKYGSPRFFPAARTKQDCPSVRISRNISLSFAHAIRKHQCAKSTSPRSQGYFF